MQLPKYAANEKGDGPSEHLALHIQFKVLAQGHKHPVLVPENVSLDGGMAAYVRLIQA